MQAHDLCSAYVLFLRYGSIAVGFLSAARNGLRVDLGELITDEVDVIFWRERPAQEQAEDIEI